MRKLMVLVAVAALALAGYTAAPAQAHDVWITLHNQNDAGAVVGSNHTNVVACDGTRNGHNYGVQVRDAQGDKAVLFDTDPGRSCNGPWNPRGVGEIKHLRSYCHGTFTTWRRVT